MAAWVENEAKRANRNLLGVNLFILGAVLVAACANGQYCLNFFLGCQKIEASELARLTSPTRRMRNFVTVGGSKSVPTGYQDIVKQVDKYSGQVTSTEVKDEYVLLKAGERVLLVKAPPGPEKLEYSGELVPTRESVQRDLIQPLAADHPEFGHMILPFTLNAADYRERGFWGLGLGLPLLLLSGWNCSKGFRRQSEIQSTPIWRHLSAYGEVQQLSLQIEAEQRPDDLNFGGLRVTRSWLIKRSSFSTWVSPIDDLAWVYKKVTKHSVNFIPTGKTYSVVLVGRHRQRVEAQMKEAAVNALLQHLAARVPWAIYGYDKNVAAAWQKDPAGFVAVIDSRRQKSSAFASPQS